MRIFLIVLVVAFVAWLIYQLIGAKMILDAARLRSNGNGGTVVNNYAKSPPGKTGIPGTDTGFNIDMSWLFGPAGEGVEKKIVTYTNE